MKGELRRDILDACKEDCPDFVPELTVFIDNIESKVNDIADDLDITSAADLEKIYDAKTKAEQLADELY